MLHASRNEQLRGETAAVKTPASWIVHSDCRIGHDAIMAQRLDLLQRYPKRYTFANVSHKST